MNQQPPHRRTEQGHDRRQRTQQYQGQPRQPPQQSVQQPPQQYQGQRQPVRQLPRYVSQQPRQRSRQQSLQQQPKQHPQPRQQQAQASDVQRVERGDDYVHVRFRNPGDFETIRTPDWAAHAARGIAPGAEVRTGRLKRSGEWRTESVLIPTPVDEQTAARLATQIVEKIGE